MSARRSHEANAVARKRVLLILDACQVGDALRVVHYLRAVREHYPTAHLTLLVNEDALEALQHVDIFDRVVISRLFYHRPYSRFGARFSKARQLLRLVWQVGIGYDVVITYYSGSPLLQLLGYAACRRQRVGFQYPGMPSRLLTTQLEPYDWYGSATEQHIALLRAAGIYTDNVAAPSMRWAQDDVEAMARLLREHGVANMSKLIVLHTGSDWACQQWLQERWAELADALVARYGATVVFTGLSNEADYVSDIQRRMTMPSISLVGQTSLTQLASLLARCCLCVCVDSAIFELTQATNVPAVTLAGPSRPDLVVPGKHLPVVVNRMQAEMVAAVRSCRQTQACRNVQSPARMPTSTGCLNYQCRMAGLREIAVDDVLGAVARQAQVIPIRVEASRP